MRLTVVVPFVFTAVTIGVVAACSGGPGDGIPTLSENEPPPRNVEPAPNVRESPNPTATATPTGTATATATGTSGGTNCPTCATYTCNGQTTVTTISPNGSCTGNGLTLSCNGQVSGQSTGTWTQSGGIITITIPGGNPSTIICTPGAAMPPVVDGG
jgi:hypothetical protein